MHYATSLKVAGSVAQKIMRLLLNSLNPSGHIMALGFTQQLSEISTRNHPGGKRRPARKADYLTAFCRPIV
jgi:hypothetical protein